MRTCSLVAAALASLFASSVYGACTSSSPYACAASSFTIPSTTGQAGSSAVTASGLTGSISKVTVTITNWTDNGALEGPSDREFMLVFTPGGGGTQKFQFLGGFSSESHGFSNLTFTFDDSSSNYAPDNFDFLVSPPTGDGPPVNNATYKPTVNHGSDTCSGQNVNAQFPSPAPSTAPCATDNPNGESESSGGTATFASQFSGNPNGTWTLYAITNAEDNEDSTASIGGWTVTITTQANAANTNTALASNATNNETLENTSVTFTATVTSTSTVNAGTVTFTDETTGATLASNVAVSNGSATAAASFSQEGSHTIQAAYTGTANFGNSNGSLNLFVDHATTNPQTGEYCNTGTITINTTTQPGTIPYPQHITIPSQSGATLSGLQLSLPGITLPNGTLHYLNLLLVDPLGHKFIALSGTGGFHAISGLNLTLSDFGGVTVPDTTVTSGTYLPTDDNTGLAFPSGTPSGPYNLPQNQGSQTFATTFSGADPAGQWSLYVYDASGDDTGSIGGYCLTITTSGAAATTTSVISTPSGSATAGEQVTFTATVKTTSGQTPVTGGTVTFKENGTVLSGPATVDGNGQGTFPTTSLSEGIHNITAAYSGVAGTYNVSSGSVSIEIDTATTNPSAGVYCNPGGLSIAGNNGGTNIPASPYPSRINVTNLAGAVQSVTVSLDTFSDAFPQNSRLLLVGPTSTDIVFWDNAGGSGGFSGSTFTIADSASGAISETSTPPAGSYRPTAYADNPQGVFPSPAPVSQSLAAPAGSQTLTSAFQSVNPNGYWDLYLYDRGGDSAVSMGKYCLNFVETPPVLAIAETGPTTATQGQTGVPYTITVTNNGPGSTSGTITATATASSGLTLTGLSSTDASWTCSATNCTRTAALTSSTITATYTVTDTASSPQTASSSVSGGGSSGTVTSNTVTTTINPGTAMVSFSTSPSGLSYTVDSTPYTSAQTLTLNFGPHTIATTSPQTSDGTQNTFTSWSDSGAISHSITVGSSSATSYTATFSTSYLLTTAANPADGGTVTPTSGTYYAPGTAVNLAAAAKPGYAFSSWTGSVASANNASTTVTMNAPQTVTANFTSAGGTSLGGLIGIKSGPANARVWPFIVGNQGPGAAAGAQISSLILQQTRGVACTPAIVTALPLALGDIAPKGSATGNVTIDFSSCQTGVMFKATVALSANSGAATGSISKLNQLP